MGTQKQPAQPTTGVAHCRICGYTPRKPRPGEPDWSWDKIVDHIEAKHPDDALPTSEELAIFGQHEEGR
jgi:hypothetical protein